VSTKRRSTGKGTDGEPCAGGTAKKTKKVYIRNKKGNKGRDQRGELIGAVRSGGMLERGEEGGSIFQVGRPKGKNRINAAVNEREALPHQPREKGGREKGGYKNYVSARRKRKMGGGNGHHRDKKSHKRGGS